jgi:hypothetical protein
MEAAAIADSPLQRYERDAYAAIEGWLEREVLWALRGVADFHRQHGITGAVCEIGVHHGRFFLALESATPPPAPCYAIDVFEQQQLNVDRSGKGDLAIFQRHLDNFARAKDRVIVKPMDSTSAEARKFFRSIEGTVALFSVDGGHTVAHTTTDLRSAENALCRGGVVFQDDYFHPDWPGVTEGLLAYFSGVHALVPVMAIGRKLLLTRMSDAPAFVGHFKPLFAAETALRAKMISFGGYNYWSVSTRRI